MNRAEAFREEQERIREQLGYYVTLDQASNFIKTASKIVSLIANSSYSVSYQEARIILKLADKSLMEISGGME